MPFRDSFRIILVIENTLESHNLLFVFTDTVDSLTFITIYISNANLKIEETLFKNLQIMNKYNYSIIHGEK